MSPDSSVLASSSIASVVISPAGTITQTTRGVVSLSTSSDSDDTPVILSSPANRLYRVRVVVVHNAFVPVVDQPADDICAHPAQADHP